MLEKNIFIHENVNIKKELLELAANIAIDAYFSCSVKLKIKEYVHIGPHVSIIGGKDAYCEIGNFCGIAAGCRLICCSDEYLGEGIINPFIDSKYRDNLINKPIILKDFVTLATNVIVLPGVTFGEGSVVSAGSIVTKDILPWKIYAGNPARPILDRKKEKILQYAKELGYITNN